MNPWGPYFHDVIIPQRPYILVLYHQTSSWRQNLTYVRILRMTQSADGNKICEEQSVQQDNGIFKYEESQGGSEV